MIAAGFADCCEGAMSEPKKIEGTIATDVWALAGALDALLFFDEQRQRDKNPDLDLDPEWYPDTPSHTSGPDEHGYNFTLTDPSPHIIGRVLGRISLIRGEGSTFVRMLVDPSIFALADRLYQALEITVNNTQRLRQRWQPSAEQVIERYYRSRAAGARTTLRQLAKDTGFSYGYLRSVKVEYDRAGKWGSKKRLSGSGDTKDSV